MDAKPLIVIGAIGAGLAVLFASRQGKAASLPVQRYAPAGAPPSPDHIYGGATVLSPHFTVAEWLKSPIQGYKLTQAQFNNLFALVTKVLEPYRQKIDPSTINITGGGRPQDFRTSAPITVTNWQTKQPVVVPAGSLIDDIIRAQGYSPVADSDHHNFAGADFTIMTGGQPDTAKMEAAYKDLQANPDVRQVGIYRVNGAPTHVHIAVVYPDHPRLTGSNFAYDTSEGE